MTPRVFSMSSSSSSSSRSCFSSMSSSSLFSESVQSTLLILRSTSKLDGQLRNLSRGRWAISFSTLGFCLNSLVSSFCSFPISSGVKSGICSEEDGSSLLVMCLSIASLLFPNVPIASKPSGQSLNSSRPSCFPSSKKFP
ncbi:hypothetical protein V8G54_008771, partial [Vigna mungo]